MGREMMMMKAEVVAHSLHAALLHNKIKFLAVLVVRQVVCEIYCFSNLTPQHHLHSSNFTASSKKKERGKGEEKERL